MDTLYYMGFSFKKEIQRKLIHLAVSLLIIIIIVLVSENLGKQVSLLLLVFLLIIFLLVDYWRVELKNQVPVICHLFRDKEKDKFGGQIFFLIGGIIVYSIFDFRIALAAVLMASFGDLAANLVGGGLGRIWITKNRNLEGILAEFVVDLAIAYFLINNFYIILVMALTATLVETLVNELDDNLFIPVFSGFAGQIISYFI